MCFPKCPKCGSDNTYYQNWAVCGSDWFMCIACNNLFRKSMIVSGNKEICICAAIRCSDGTIIRGHQHRDCRDGAVRRGKKPGKNWEDEGFITSENRYVDREEGYKLMIDAGWESKNPQGYQLCEFLFSEDLY